MPPPYAPQSGGTVAPTPQTVERPGTHEALGKHELLLLTTPTFLAPDCPVPGVPNEAVTFWKSGMRLTGPGVAGGLTLSRPGPAPSRCPLPARAAGASGGAATAASNRPHDGVCPPPPPVLPRLPEARQLPSAAQGLPLGEGWLWPPRPRGAHWTQICDFPWISR